MNCWTSLRCQSPGIGGTLTASTMPALLVTSTSLDTVAHVGLMAAPAQLQVGSAFVVFISQTLHAGLNVLLSGSYAVIRTWQSWWNWRFNKNKTLAVIEQLIVFQTNTIYFFGKTSVSHRPHQHQARWNLAIGLSFHPTHPGLRRRGHLSRRRPRWRVCLRPHAWHPRRDLQQLPGNWPT